METNGNYRYMFAAKRHLFTSERLSLHLLLVVMFVEILLRKLSSEMSVSLPAQNKISLSKCTNTTYIS